MERPRLRRRSLRILRGCIRTRRGGEPTSLAPLSSEKRGGEYHHERWVLPVVVSEDLEVGLAVP